MLKQNKPLGINIINNNIDKLKSLCKEYKVFRLYLFGSVISPHFTKESDIDFLVSFKEIDLLEYADNYFDFKFSLEKLLKRDIDLLEEKAIKNPFLLNSIETSKQLIYG